VIIPFSKVEISKMLKWWNGAVNYEGWHEKAMA